MSTNDPTKTTEKLLRSLKAQLADAGKTFSKWLSAGTAMTKLIRQLEKMPEAVYELDSAMESLYRATNAAGSSYGEFLDSAAASAHSLGTSLSGLIRQTAAFAGMGFSLTDAAELAKSASVYANIAGTESAAAASHITSALQAFGLEASGSLSVVDKLGRLGKEFTVGADALGSGLSKSASSLAAAGTGLDQSLAMLAAASGQDASGFGSFLDVSAMRLLGMRDSLAALGEEASETAGSIQGVQKQVLRYTGGKVNTLGGMGQLRDYYDIMEDISRVYDGLSATNRAGLDEVLFGKRHMEQGQALLQAFQSGQVQKALEASSHSDGFAMQEQERCMESLEAKTRQFEAAFQSLSSTLLGSGLLQWFVDFGTGGVQALDAIAGKLGTLGTLGAGAGLFTGLKNVGSPKMFGHSVVLNIPTVCRSCRIRQFRAHRPCGTWV